MVTTSSSPRPLLLVALLASFPLGASSAPPALTESDILAFSRERLPEATPGAVSLSTSMSAREPRAVAVASVDAVTPRAPMFSSHVEPFFREPSGVPQITEDDVRAFLREPLQPARSVAALALPVGAVAGGVRPAEQEPVQCALDEPHSDEATSESCLSCHTTARERSHPCDLDYARAAQARPFAYAPVDAVVRAGVLLPNGEIRCVTCHDGRSQWKYKIALPPGSKPSPSVAWLVKHGLLDGPVPTTPLPPGSDVTPTPLCKVCHQF